MGILARKIFPKALRLSSHICFNFPLYASNVGISPKRGTPSVPGGKFRRWNTAHHNSEHSAHSPTSRVKAARDAAVRRRQRRAYKVSSDYDIHGNLDSVLCYFFPHHHSWLSIEGNNHQMSSKLLSILLFKNSYKQPHAEPCDILSMHHIYIVDYPYLIHVESTENSKAKQSSKWEP